MKAIRVHQTGEPEVMVLEQVPDPTPGPRQVVVQAHAAGVNPVDTYIRSGAYSASAPLPYTPGMDAAGTIAAVGSEVSDWKAGDRVYTAGTVSGAYAELVLCEAHQVHCLPDRISFEEGAGVNVPFATAYRALFQKALVRPGETVLVHGASGGVGTAAIQLARAHGIHVIGTAGTPRGLQLIKELGADAAIDHSQAGYEARITELTNQAGPDVILEMRADLNLTRDLQLLAPHGRVVIIGSRGALNFEPRLTMGKEAVVSGLYLLQASPPELREIHAGLVAGLANGTLCPVVGETFLLQEAPAAHRAILAPGSYGKIVLLP